MNCVVVNEAYVILDIMEIDLGGEVILVKLLIGISPEICLKNRLDTSGATQDILCGWYMLCLKNKSI